MQQLLIVHGTKYILTNKEITVEPLLENIGKIAPTTRFHQAEKRIRVGGKKRGKYKRWEAFQVHRKNEMWEKLRNNLRGENLHETSCLRLRDLRESSCYSWNWRWFMRLTARSRSKIWGWTRQRFNALCRITWGWFGERSWRVFLSNFIC